MPVHHKNVLFLKNVYTDSGWFPTAFYAMVTGDFLFGGKVAEL